MKSLLVVMLLARAAFAADPLPSWNDTATKKAIMTFVEKVTSQGSPDVVPVPDRIATFDCQELDGRGHEARLEAGFPI